MTAKIQEETLAANTDADSVGNRADVRADIRAAAARVLRLEADGLQGLAAQLDENFDAAVALLSGIKGKLVISGMGKSG
ncbi:MAG: KpsF/GutQ family sugar-phosphate isomerase, partial [Rhodospirillaceae bacterium]|nr:KpsF/GutQ family sugar-phosphate isomerase [Rhodospirillaceae bacterium]